LEALRVSIVQIGRLESGKLDDLKELIVKLARKAGVGDLVLLPENWISRTPIDVGAFERILLDVYNSLGSCIASGAQYVVDVDGAVRSVGLAIIDGSVVRICEKIHPSKAVGERDRIVAGRLIGPFKVKGWAIGCLACVDVFYPEISRALVARGAQVLYNPASIPENRVGLWQSVVRARSIENAVYSIGVNAFGNRYRDGRVTSGGSVAFNPWGGELALLDPRLEAKTIELDPGEEELASKRWGFREDFEKRYKRLYEGLF
jgi:predicted amidohydrolase